MRLQIEAPVNLLRYPRVYLFLSGMILIAGASLSIGGAEILGIWPRIIVGLLVLLLPGCYLFVLFPTREDWDLADVVGYGFSYSLAMITILGLIARTLTLSISALELIWYLLALLGLGAVWFKTESRRGRRSEPPAVHPQFYLLLAIVFGLVALYAHGSILMASNSDDQSRHHGMIHGFLRNEPLGWSEPYYESGNRIGDQDYLTYWVLAQALVSKISSAHILLARYLINPFVLLMSVAAMYVFARNLGHCRKTSLAVVIVGLLALSLIAWKGRLAGNQLLVHAHLDKVLASFALAPVAISSAWLYADTGNRRALWGFALSFLACAFVHSVIGGFVLCIVGFWCLLYCISNRSGRRQIVEIALLALILFFPSILLRLISSQPTISAIGSGNWYFGIEPRHAGLLTYVVFALTAVCALVRRDARSRLLLSFLVVIGIGLLPLTAWMYRIVLPDFQIRRVVWLMPYGYMLVFVIGTCWSAISSRYSLNRSTVNRLRLSLLILAFPISGYFLQFHSRADFSIDIASVPEEVSELLDIADYIDAQHDDRVWIAASSRDNLHNRAIGLHWKAISLSRYSAERMAYYSSLPLEQTAMQRADNFRLYDAAVPVDEKLAIIDRYDIAYLLFDRGYAWMVDALYQTDKDRFEQVYSGEKLRLVRVNR